MFHLTWKTCFTYYTLFPYKHLLNFHLQKTHTNITYNFFLHVFRRLIRFTLFKIVHVIFFLHNSFIFPMWFFMILFSQGIFSWLIHFHVICFSRFILRIPPPSPINSFSRDFYSCFFHSLKKNIQLIYVHVSPPTIHFSRNLFSH